MRRRAFLAGIAGAGAAWPLRVIAQPSALPLIGYLDAAGLPLWFSAFQRGLTELGYVQG
jgi:hypothetical protein